MSQLNINIPSPVLPYDSMTDAQKLSYLQNERQLKEQIAYRKELQQEREDAKRGQYLNQFEQKATSKHTGLQRFDNWFNDKVADLYEKYTTDPNYANMNPTQLEYSLNSEWIPLLQGYNSVTDAIKRESDDVNNFVGQNKWADKEKLMNDVYNGIAGKYFTQNDKGEWEFHRADKINDAHSILGDLINSPDAWRYTNDAAIGDFYKNLTSPKQENRDYVLKDNESVRHFKGQLSPFEVENIKPDEKGFVSKVPTYSIISEGRTDENGNPIYTLPEETIKTYMANTVGNQMAMKKLFNDYAQAQNIDVSKLTPQQLETEIQKFAYTAVKNTRNNQPYLHNITAIPKQPNVNVNTAQPAQINNVYESIMGKLNDRKNSYLQMNLLSLPEQKEIIDLAKAVLKNDDNEKIGSEDLLIKYSPDGTPSLYKIQTPGTQEDYNKYKGLMFVAPLDFKGLNLPANKTQKEKQEVLKQAQKGTNDAQSNNWQQYKRP